MRHCNLRVALLAFLSIGFLADRVLPQKGPSGYVAADPFNSRLAIQVGTNGRFNMGAFPDPLTGGVAGGSYNLIYAWPNSPGTSFSTLRIDGIDNIFGSSGFLVQPPTDIDNKTNVSKWQIGDIEVTQTLQLTYNNQTGQDDIAKISYAVRNTGVVPHDTGVRIMIDTMLNNNDGAPFRIPGVGIVTTEREFTGAAIPDTFQAFYDVTDSEHVSAATLRSGGATTPDRLVLARWPAIVNTLFDYAITPTASFTNDSAYATYWNPTSLAPGSSRTYSTLYGLSNLQVDLQPPLALGVAGPTTLSLINNQYSPNPFDVVATVFNNGTATATGVVLTINLPAGLSLTTATPFISLGDLGPGSERQVSWQVVAGPRSNAGTVDYSVTASSTNTASKTVTRQITIPALVLLPPPITLKPPYQFFDGCNATTEIDGGAGSESAVNVVSRPLTGDIDLNVRAGGIFASSFGRVGVGVTYLPTFTGSVKIHAIVSVGPGFDAVAMTALPKIGSAGVASIDSGLFITASPPVDALSVSRFRAAIVTPISGGSALGFILKSEQHVYQPAETFAVEHTAAVSNGRPLRICAGIQSKAATTALPGIFAMSKGLYSAKVLQIRIMPQ